MRVAALKNVTPGTDSGMQIRLVDDEPVDEVRVASGDRRSADLETELGQHLRRRTLDRLTADDRRHGNHRRMRLLYRSANARQREDRLDADERIRGADDDGAQIPALERRQRLGLRACASRRRRT